MIINHWVLWSPYSQTNPNVLVICMTHIHPPCLELITSRCCLLWSICTWQKDLWKASQTTQQVTARCCMYGYGSKKGFLAKWIKMAQSQNRDWHFPNMFNQLHTLNFGGYSEPSPSESSELMEPSPSALPPRPVAASCESSPVPIPAQHHAKLENQNFEYGFVWKWVKWGIPPNCLFYYEKWWLTTKQWWLNPIFRQTHIDAAMESSSLGIPLFF